MRILIAEDEIATAKALQVLLKKNNYTVDIVHNGNDAWDYIGTNLYDTIVLDIMMPGKSGIEVLKLLRKNQIRTPVLMLTAKAELEDRIAGLDAGADDYLPKPFAAGELIARVRALLRRSDQYTDSQLQIGNLVLDQSRYEISACGQTVRLTNKEYQPGVVFSSDHLMEKIWGWDSESDTGVVWTHIGFIRKKLRTLQTDVEIRTIRGAGYALEVK